MTAAMGLWADQLMSGPIAAISQHTALYNALFIFTVVVRHLFGRLFSHSSHPFKDASPLVFHGERTKHNPLRVLRTVDRLELIQGSYSVRHEHRWWMSLFLAVCFVYIACWSIMFYSQGALPSSSELLATPDPLILRSISVDLDTMAFFRKHDSCLIHRTHRRRAVRHHLSAQF